jgi:hypothetical protein
MKLPAMLVHVGVNEDIPQARRRGWVGYAEDGSVLGFLVYSKELEARGYGTVPVTPLIRITTTQYYEYLTKLPLLPNSI